MSAALASAGVRVHTRRRVNGMEALPSGWSLRTGSEDVVADAVVVAVPPPVAEQVLPAGVLGVPAGWAAALGSAPIVNVHVVYDRRVLDEPFLAAVDSPVQWVFDRTGQSGLRDGQYVALSLSAAQGIIDTRTAVLRDQLLPELARLLPPAARAGVEEVFVTREREATFHPAPGTARFRPAQQTTAPGLYVAGAWTATGWPATMEGAVRSGEAAAAALLAQTARPSTAGRAA
jgi:monoamine oxidase